MVVNEIHPVSKCHVFAPIPFPLAGYAIQRMQEAAMGRGCYVYNGFFPQTIPITNKVKFMGHFGAEGKQPSILL